LSDVTDIVVYDTGLAPNNIALLSDDRIIMTFADQNADRKLLKLNIDPSTTEVTSHTKLFPGTRDMAIESIHHVNPGWHKDTSQAIYLVLSFENMIEKVQESTGQLLTSFKINEWVSLD
jgi:hypothetical protein